MAGIEIVLPGWLDEMVSSAAKLPTVESRMQFAIALARANVEHRTGGPFGAVVCDTTTGRILGAGVNLVQASRCSVAHAEVVAIATAQKAMGHYDLGAESVDPELVTSVEPCAMCLGAIVWSGVRRVVYGARSADACQIGFDEGPRPQDWVGQLEGRGIAVIRDLMRQDARAVLDLYVQTGGCIYNPSRPRHVRT